MADTPYPLWMYPDEPPVKEPIEPPSPAEDPNAFPRGYRGLRIPGASSDEEFILREALKRLAVLLPPTQIPTGLLASLEDNPAPGTVTPVLVQTRNYLDLLTGLLGVLGYRGSMRVPQETKPPRVPQPANYDPITGIQLNKEYLGKVNDPFPKMTGSFPPMESRESARLLERRARSMTERIPVPPLPDAKSVLPPEPIVIDLNMLDDLWP